ncbi:protein kinase domain-containing protein [Deinococcus malanensis]|nr:hypothetical protein [Deinococcus malanensis]
MKQFVDGQGHTVHLGRELGRGGQGAVYEVAQRKDTVAKIYLSAPDRQAVRKLDALARASDPQLLSISAWPQTVLKDSSGHTHGFVMPLVNETEYHELHNLYRLASRRKHFPSADWRFLVHVARNVSRAFAVLHRHGHLMGDVSARNVMVSQQGIVRFIDTDSFQIKVGADTFPCPVGTAEFTPPELQGTRFGALIRTAEHDLFGLALLIFHLLFEGRHPYAGVHDNGSTPSPAEAIAADKFAFSLRHRHGVRPPPFSLTLSALHVDLQDLFERSFSPRHRGRPTAAEWEGTLAELFAQLATCIKNPSHKHDRRLACPWCALLPGNAQSATAKTGIPAAAKRLDVEGELNRIWLGVRSLPVPAAPGPVVLSARPSPLPLPALPALPEPQPVLRASATVWGALFLLMALYVGSQGGGWLTLVVLGGLSWFNFRKNTPAAVQARQAGQLAKFKAQQRATYQALLNQQREEFERQADEVRRELSRATDRQQGNSVLSRYKRALKSLEEGRAAVRAIDQEEQDQLLRVVKQHRQPVLDRHLAQHHLRPGDVPGVGPTLIAMLNKNGVYTAKDITPSVRWIKGVGPKRYQDLVQWRDTLEQFFQFNPALISPQEFDLVRSQLDKKRGTKLKALEAAVAQLKRDLPGWQVEEDAATRQVRALKQQLAQYEATIETIERGVPELN